MQPQSHIHSHTRRINAAASSPLNTEFRSFKLGREEYGVDILNVQESRSYGWRRDGICR